MKKEEVDPSPVPEFCERSFFDSSLGVRIGIGLLFTIAILFFVHFRTVPLEVVELDSVSDSEVVTPVAFEVPNEEATALARQSARQSIGSIYRIHADEIKKQCSAVEEELENDQSWRSDLPDLPLEDLDDALDEFCQSVAASRFSDSGTLEAMNQAGLSTANYQPYAPDGLSTPIELPAFIWDHLEEEAFVGQGLPSTVVSLIVGPFSTRQWQLQEDHVAQRAAQRVVQEQVEPIMRTIPVGSRILDRGERVTAQHVVAVSAMQSQLEEGRSLWEPARFIGSLLLALLMTIVGTAYLRSYHQSIYRSNKQLFLIATVIVLTLALAKLIEVLLLRTDSQVTDALRYPLFLPFAAILLCSLVSARVAIVVSGFTALILVVTLPVSPVGFLIINLLTAVVAILNVRSLRRRKEVFAICAKAWVASIFVLLAFHLYDGTLFPMGSFFVDLLTTCLFMLFTAVIVIGLLPLLEAFFSVVTDITLMEFMDPAHPLLRRLALEAPGTYHHSIVLGNITEAAATAIGAGGLFCRAATLYHDVGKLANPQFFTENQHGEMNIHQLLTPMESTQVILGHVTEGIAMAEKYNLPQPFIDVIRQHHGTTLVYYFYRKQLELMGGDESLVNKADFSYPGPKPRTKEAAIVMIADTIEAASRSLDDLNEESVRELVDRMVRVRVEERQLDECPLTFQELEVVKESIIKTLLIASHSRIKYPVRPAKEEQ